MSSILLAAVLAFPAGNPNADAVRRAALEALDRGEGDKALALADKAVRVDPRDARSHHVRGLAHAWLRRHKDAVADFTKAIELDPKSADSHDQRGSEHFKLGDFARSLEDFDKAIVLDSERSAGHWRRGITCYYARRFDEGRKQFNAYEKVDTNDVENAVWHYLCNVPLVGQEKARAALLKIGKDRRVPMMEVYELFKGKLKPDDVLKAARAGEPAEKALNSRLFYAHLYLGLYHESRGEAKEALRHLEAATEHRIGHYMWDVARVHRDVLKKAK
jgi:lipoprotein NlpI